MGVEVKVKLARRYIAAGRVRGMRKVRLLSRLWKSGAACAQISEALGLPKGTNVWRVVARLRREHGTHLFPRRAPEPRQVDVDAVSWMWRAGFTSERIATQVGRDVQAARCLISRLRQKHGEEMFPYRCHPEHGSPGLDAAAEEMRTTGSVPVPAEE